MKCCSDANKCCQKMQKTKKLSGTCPMKWDGWTCWDPVDSNSDSYQTCPDMSLFLMGELPPSCVRSNAKKVCESNGQWLEHTDYTSCSIINRSTRLHVIWTTIIIESFSLLFSIIGLSLIIHFRLYYKFRLMIHSNYFVTIILSSLITILYNILVTKAHIDRTNYYVYKS